MFPLIAFFGHGNILQLVNLLKKKKKKKCQHITDYFEHAPNLTDERGFCEIVNWMWVASRQIKKKDFSLLSWRLQATGPTHASQFREEARTRMADTADVGILKHEHKHSSTLVTDCDHPPTVLSGRLFRCTESDTKVQNYVTHWQARYERLNKWKRTGA